MAKHKSNDQVEVPLFLTDAPPTFVTGPRAFTLNAPRVGLVEVGDPLPGDDIWDYFDGDLMQIMVREMNGRTSGGGGGTWDSAELAVHCSVPASGDYPLHDGYVIAGRIPHKFTTIRVAQGNVTYRQTPINGTIAIPLDHSEGELFRVFGQERDGEEELLFDSSVFNPNG